MLNVDMDPLQQRNADEALNDIEQRQINTKSALAAYVKDLH